jgi:GT2 family glycosyltransferase
MIDIVIVNWNAGNQLLDCASSVIANTVQSVSSITVVDNGSTDGSAEMVMKLSEINVMFTGENLGFATACNLGASSGNAPYILFLNPDTRVESHSFTAPLSFMERHESSQVGICGIRLIDDGGNVSQTCARFPTLIRFVSSSLGLDKLPGLRGIGVHMRDWDHGCTRQVDHVMGAFYLIRRNVFHDLKGFDERFFVYLEDLDLSYRAQLAGWDSWYLADASAYHAGGGTSRQVKAHRLFYSLRSRLLYGFKHFPKWQAWSLVFVTVSIEPFTRFAWCLARGDRSCIRHTLSAYRMLWRALPGIIKGEGRFVP